MNTEEGDVEIIAQGGNDSIAKFIDWCHEGPRKAVVSSIDITEVEEQELTEFKVIR